MFIAVFAMVSAGCTKQEVKNERFKDTFLSWNEDINMLTCDVIAPAMHFSRWLNAPEENQHLAFFYFKCLNPYIQWWTATVPEVNYFQKITPDTWLVSYKNTSLSFRVVQGRDLFSRGCIMEVTLSDNAESKNPFVNHTITLENTGDNEWAISCHDDENCHIQGTVTKDGPYGIEVSKEVSFSGTGRIKYYDPSLNGFAVMEFKTLKPYVWERAVDAETQSYNEFGCPWWNTEGMAKRNVVAGMMELTVSDDQSDNNAAIITVTGKNQIQVKSAGFKRSWEIEPY